MLSYSVAIFIFSYIIELATCNEVDNGLLKTVSLEEKRSRLIAFDSEHGEVKVELDFAVPFMKIPLGTKRSGGHILEPLLEVNSRGLVTVATMIFLFITIIPKIVKLFIPHAHVSTTDGLIPLMSRIDEALHSMDIPSTECYQRSACWVGSSTANLINQSNFMNTRVFSSTDWLNKALNRPDVMEALRKGQSGEDCTIYKCSLPMQAITKVISLGRSMFGISQ